MTDRILLIDGHNAMWRANVSFGPPTTHDMCEGYDNTCHNPKHMKEPHCYCGSPWSVEENYCYGQQYLIVYNFFRNLRPIIQDGAPDKCFFVLEGHPQFRYDLYPDYKANRIIKQAARKDDMDKFHRQKGVIFHLMHHLPITMAIAHNYECDDVIGTLCENMKEEDLTVLSSDSDFIQLLQRGYKHLTVYNPIKKVAMEAPPYPYVAWKSLNGDKSDNIPALLKPKKALDCVNDPELFKKFMEVEENRANFNINRQLIEFRSVPEEEIELIEGKSNWDQLKFEFDAMKFSSIINDKSWDKYTKTFDCIKF